MLAEIVLSAGTDRISVGKIPALFADAIHPPLSQVALRIITHLKKFPLTEENKRLWCGAGIGMAFPVSLSAGDMDALQDGAWRGLPPLILPIVETEWEPYREAFERKPPTDWRLEVTHINPNTGEDEMAFANVSLAPAPNANAASRDPKNPSTWGKIGRNEDCPCGSGKKYKHCHGRYA